jgi:hypothetical protein
MNRSRTVLSYVGAYSSSLVARLTSHESRITILSSLMVLFSGCVTYRAPAPSAAYYYLNRDKDLTAIGRVAIVELDNDSSYPQISTDITQALFRALQKEQVFGLTVVRQHDPSWRSLQLDLDWSSQMQNNALVVRSTYTLDQISAIRETLKCNGVLIGTITEFKPYPHMIVGLRLKLLDLRDGQLLWALEQVWDSADKATEYRIKHYFRSQKYSDLPLRERLAAVSPIEFLKFVSYEVAETL